MVFSPVARVRSVFVGRVLPAAHMAARDGARMGAMDARKARQREELAADLNGDGMDMAAKLRELFAAGEPLDEAHPW